MQEAVTRTREQGTVVTVPQDGAERIAAIRKIVAEKQYAKVDGVMVDLFTAGAVVQVYDAVNDANKAAYCKLKVTVMAGIAFKLLK